MTTACGGTVERVARQAAPLPLVNRGPLLSACASAQQKQFDELPPLLVVGEPPTHKGENHG